MRRKGSRWAKLLLSNGGRGELGEQWRSIKGWKIMRCKERNEESSREIVPENRREGDWEFKRENFGSNKVGFLFSILFFENSFKSSGRGAILKRGRTIVKATTDGVLKSTESLYRVRDIPPSLILSTS
ncbi:unnamed protein product [Citrullus colocynthis]|uniref:Uncharacterized protein n=1 Tax=Citrullus colocynthis TaxID=252529 RepID=A0ABP0XZT5_9ROSI